MKDINAILIGGVGRSGTNVLKYIFATHPDVFSLPFETRFTVDPDGLFSTYCLLENGWSPFVSELSIQRLKNFLKRVSKRDILDNMVILGEFIGKNFVKSKNFRAYKEWELDKVFTNFSSLNKELIDSLELMQYNGSWAGARYNFGSGKIKVGYSDSKDNLKKIINRYLYSLYTTVLENNNKLYYVEDNTFNILYAHVIEKTMPNSLLVHMIRDPRDIVASYLKQRWCPKDLTNAVKYYKELMDRWLVIKNQLSKESYIEIRLEDLCFDTEGTLKSICEKRFINYDPIMLNYPLDKANSGRWRGEFTLEEQVYINNELKEYIALYNY